jgi:hypothetical protein
MQKAVSTLSACPDRTYITTFVLILSFRIQLHHQIHRENLSNPISIMLLNTATLSLATLSTVVGAQILAEFVPNKRTVLPSGGWSLSSFNGGCPFDAPQCGATWCCPTSLTCVPTGSGDVAEVCCPACEWLFNLQFHFFLKFLFFPIHSQFHSQSTADLYTTIMDVHSSITQQLFRT